MRIILGPSRRGANSAALVVVVVLVAHSYCHPSCAFLPPGAPQKNILLPARRPRDGSRRIIAASSKPPSSPPPPKPARAAAAVEKKKKTPVGVTPLSFGGRVRTSSNKIELEAELPSSQKSLEREERDEEDTRRSARWGVKPNSPPKLGVALGNPLKAVGSSLKVVGQGATAAKDALYDVANAITTPGSLLPKLPEQQRDSSDQGGGTSDGIIASGKSTGGGLVGALRVVGEGAVITKDAFWGTLDALGYAADAVGKAPETTRSVAEGARAALQGAKANAEAVVRAPGAAVSAVSDAAGAVSGGAARVLGGAKEIMYGAAEAVTLLARAPGEIAQRQRRDQQERERKAAENDAGRTETGRKIASAVGGAKEVVWGTVEGVETLVNTMAATPAAVSDGLGQAKEAAASARELVEAIPRTVQDIPLEAQRKLDGTLASIDSAQDAARQAVSTTRGGIDGISKAFQRVATMATGEDKRQREEKMRKEKEKNAVVTLRGQPYSVQDLAVETVKAAGTTAKGAFIVGKSVVSSAGAVASAPAKVARAVLGPVYEYQQSKKRVREAVKLQEASSRVQPPATSTPVGDVPPPPPPPAASPTDIAAEMTEAKPATASASEATTAAEVTSKISENAGIGVAAGLPLGTGSEESVKGEETAVESAGAAVQTPSSSPSAEVAGSDAVGKREDSRRSWDKFGPGINEKKT